jgi:hypothetical protein
LSITNIGVIILNIRLIDPAENRILSFGTVGTEGRGTNMLFHPGKTDLAAGFWERYERGEFR